MPIRRTVSLALLAAFAVAGGARPALAQQPLIDFDALRDETATRLAEYIAINTSNPPGNELATARWLQTTLAREGIEGEILDTAELGPGRANFYARIRGSGANRKAVALVSHMDVVPASREYWSVDPFAGTIKDGYLWGRGTLDMKGHAVIQLMALVALRRAGVTLPRDVVFLANADEESDGIGSRTFVRRHADLLRDVEFLITEGADTYPDSAGRVRTFGVDVGEKRPFWQRLTVHGVSSHGSVPTPGNPVPRLARALQRIAAWQTPVRLLPAVERYFKALAPTQTGVARRWLADPAAALRDPKGRAWLLAEPERAALLRNTLAPTVLVGSNKTNTIPPVAQAEVDVRLLPDEDTLAFKRALIRAIDDPKVELLTIGDVPPRFSAPLDTSFFTALRSALDQLLPGVPFATQINVGASDRPYYAVLGIACYGIDPYVVSLADRQRGIHGNDERLSVENLKFGLRLYTGLLQALR